MNLGIRDGESEYEHHRRLVYGKLVDKTLPDTDYSDLAMELYGKAYSADVARRMMYGSKKTIELLERERSMDTVDKGVLSNIESRTVELKKERQKLRDERSALNKMIRNTAREEEVLEILDRAMSSGSLPELTVPEAVDISSDNDLMVSLNDMHYGADINNFWNTYNSSVCRDMIGRYTSKIIVIGKRHHSENCIVCCNGDIISGNIHYELSVTNKENVIEQVKGAAELISEMLACLSGHFKTVKFVSVAGNHSRLNPDKDMSLPCERLDDLVEWYLKARLHSFQNIEIGFGEKIDPTMYVINIRGKNYCGVHGDFDVSDAKIQSLSSMVNRELYAVLLGHMHKNKIDNVQGVKTLMAGSFQGVDSYCVQKRLIGRPEQMVAVCTCDGIDCVYDIAL